MNITADIKTATPSIISQLVIEANKDRSKTVIVEDHRDPVYKAEIWLTSLKLMQKISNKRLMQLPA